ncbi:MAG TPA: hypothetical protein DCO72_04365 [Ruminococcus sp.]|nr:hypothetical protein [Ruminococcus sp.]
MNTGYQATEQFFKDVNWKYETAENVFHCVVELESGECASVHVDTSDNTIIVFTALQHEINEKMFDKVLRMLNIINMASPVGSLFLDEETKLILCRFGQVYSSQNMTADDIGAQVSYTMDTVELISKFLPKLEDGTYQPEEVALMVIDPQETKE